MTALLWGPHYFVVRGLTQAGVSGLVLQFHLLLWPALLSWGLLLLSGRRSDLGVFQRRETFFIVLAVLGGYGFWLLRGLALDAAAGAECRHLFYAVPLFMGVAAFLSRGQASGRAIAGLLLGFVGCYVMARWSGTGSSRIGIFSRAGLLGLGAAACWAAFSVLAPRVLKEARPLPVIALVTGIGTACILVTAVTMGANVLDLSWGQARSCAVAGVLTVGLMMSFWLRCLNGAATLRTGALWYLGMVTGTLWSVLRYQHRPNWWSLLVGTILIGIAIYMTPDGGRSRQAATIGDVIRGSV
jgi:drug/metabolite transporter (DMT)-like permease